MIVRQLEESDRSVFMTLCEEFYASGATARGYDRGLTEKTFDYLMSRHENLWGYLISDKQTGVPAGYALLTSYWCNEDGGNVVILDELYIRPQDRHKGYGTSLLEWVEKEFRDKAVSITLEVVTTNTAAKDLYTRFGFADDGFEVMAKHL